MSLKDKASRIDFTKIPSSAPGASPDAQGKADLVQTTTRPKTAPGLMLQQATDHRAGLVQENDSLKAQITELREVERQVVALREDAKEWVDAKAVKLIDPTLIDQSDWANRDTRHFQTPEFEALKAEIANAGGNVQPIKVRAKTNGRYEVVFGHRRLKACQELGFKVLALIDNLDDRGLFVEMDRENRERQSLSPWEQGVHYKRAIERGLFPSNRKLAEAVGADLSQVGKAIALAELPVEIVQAFASPLDLQFRWAKPLSDLWNEDEKVVRSKLSTIASMPSRPDPKAIFELLTKVQSAPESTTLEFKGKEIGKMTVAPNGSVRIDLLKGTIPKDRLKGLAQALTSYLAK